MKTNNDRDSDAPSEHYQIKRTLWQRWMAWSGSFLVLSILAHVILLGGATVLVVQVVQSRKEKMKFTAPPPSAAGAVEHKVKPSKKTAAAAPAISKRIASTAANASIALPAMDMNASTGPDVMASVMSGLGSAGLGGGVGGAGAGGMASMPLAGLTAFGFKGGNLSGGLKGYIYDFKQTKDRQPTNIKDDGYFKDPNFLKKQNLNEYQQGVEFWRICADNSKLGRRADLMVESFFNQAAVMNEFFDKGWDQSVFERYYRSRDTMTAYQIFIPVASGLDALKAFGVEKEIKPNHFVILYSGMVTAPRDMTFRFRLLGSSRSAVYMMFNDQEVTLPGKSNPKDLIHRKYFVSTDPELKKWHHPDVPSFSQWFTVEAGKKYPMKILLESGEGWFRGCLYLEERSPAKPYPKSMVSELYPQDVPWCAYPVFALKKGVPLPPMDKAALIKQQDTYKPAVGEPHPENWRPRPAFWDYPSDQPVMIFNGAQ